MSLDALSDLDLDIDRCLQNCPELEGPLLDADLLDGLCLSDDLWANLDLHFLSDNDKRDYLNSQPLPQQAHMHTCEDVPSIPTPPQSPPDNNEVSATQNSVPVMSSHMAASNTSSFPLNFPAAPTPAQQQQQQQKKTASMTSNEALSKGRNTVIQVLKSGELVCLQVPTQATTASQAPQAVIQLPVKQESSTVVVAGQKRHHPDSGSQDTSKLTRKQQRMIKNRESACISRQKRKEYVETLEARLKEAALKNTALLQENASLRKQMTALEKENEVLRTSLSRPTSPLSSIRTPAIVLMLVFCVTLTAVPLSKHVVPLSFLSSLNTNTALLPINTHKSRALLSIEDSPVKNEQRSHALMAVSTSLTNYNMDTEFKRPKRAVARPKVLSGLTSHTCSCPSRNYTDSMNKQSHNRTLFKMINRQLLDCLKVEQAGFSSVPLSSSDDKLTKNSLAVIDPALHTTLTDMVFPENGLQYSKRLYEHFKKGFIRDFDNFYLISFKDHLLLDAPLYNVTQPPQLSVIIPTISGLQSAPQGIMTMLQINCEILDTRIIHMNLNT